jgi:hypothetical protein
MDNSEGATAPMILRDSEVVFPPTSDVWTNGGLSGDSAVGEYFSDWSDIPVGLSVLLTGIGLPSMSGLLDAKMEDGSAVWIQGGPWLRRLVHRSDGYKIRGIYYWRFPPSSNTKTKKEQGRS